MNKEEYEIRLKTQVELNKELLDNVYEWKLQYKQLQERIDKAIEYIEPRQFEKDTDTSVLLEILKGEYK